MSSGPSNTHDIETGLISGKVWQDRVSRLIAATGQDCHVQCDRDTGIDFALNRLSLDKTPLVVLRFGSVPSTSDISVELAASIQRDLGVRLLREDAPYSHSLAVLSRELISIGPTRFAVVWSDYCMDFVSELSEALGGMGQVISVSSDFRSMRHVPKQFRIVEGNSLLMSRSEALTVAGDSMTAEDAAALAAECGFRYGAFVATLHPSLANLSLSDSVSNVLNGLGSPEPRTVSDLEMLEVLVGRERWIEAFELVCKSLPNEASRIVATACHQLVDLGAFEYLWDGLSSLPETVREHPDVAYWLVVAASATNRIKQVRGLAKRVLEKSEAPDLRAAVAVLQPSVDMVLEATRAVKAMETPITLRAMGFALAYAGDRQSPVRLFRKAMKLAESVRANHLVIACAIDIANQEITLGRYTSGVYWARWALDEIERRRSNEKFRQYAALALVAYGTILSGNEAAGTEVADIVQSLFVDWSAIGAPTYESVVSTVGDWNFAIENYLVAEEHYKRVLEGVPIDQYSSAALDVVKVMIAQGRTKEARELAEAARTLATTSTHAEYALACLALGMTRAPDDASAAIDLLSEAATGLAKTNYVVFETQAILWIALIHFRMGKLDTAQSSLKRAEEGLAMLGTSGWRFLLCGVQDWVALYELWKKDTESIRLEFLGYRTIIKDGAPRRAPLRTCEVLTVLSMAEAGVSAERLQLLIFGDSSSIINAKATVSRIRRICAISQSPYQLKCKVQSDFSELLQATERGDFAKALALYKGQLLPDSDAPAIVELRDYIDGFLKESVLASGDVEAIIRLGTIMPDDLEIWERAKSLLSPGDSRSGLVNARIRRVRTQWAT